MYLLSTSKTRHTVLLACCNTFIVNITDTFHGGNDNAAL